jgi:hypothetical protein
MESHRKPHMMKRVRLIPVQTLFPERSRIAQLHASSAIIQRGCSSPDVFRSSAFPTEVEHMLANYER